MSIKSIKKPTFWLNNQNLDELWTFKQNFVNKTRILTHLTVNNQNVDMKNQNFDVKNLDFDLITKNLDELWTFKENFDTFDC